MRSLSMLLLALALPTLIGPIVRAQTPAATAKGATSGADPSALTATPAAALTTAGLVSIESDLQQADNGTGVITASGNVRIVYPDRRVVATARQAQYFSREARIVLSGDVDVIQDDGSALRAERVIVLLNSQRVVAQPRQGQQVVSTLRLDPTGVGPGQP
jgi:lipopolysaccharide export system protein LptA